MSEFLNEMVRNRWVYLRTDTLPSEERSSLTGRSTIYQNLLVFRRKVDELSDDAEPVAEATPAYVTPPKIEIKDKGENNAPALPSAKDANEAGDAAPSIKRTDS